MANPDPNGATVVLVEDFMNAFNRIEDELKRRTGLESHEGFKTAAHRFVERNRWWRRDFEAMMAFSDLRNVIVHERFDRFAYLSVPSEAVADEIRAIESRLIRPRTANDEFRREVEIVDVEDSLADLLARVRAHEFTQFPVYEGGEFLGLVTGAGVFRWLARELDGSEHRMVDFGERTVRELLEQEEARPNWHLMPRTAPVQEVAFAFTENPQLEAVLITENGREHESLLGIATQSDVVGLARDVGG